MNRIKEFIGVASIIACMSLAALADSIIPSDRLFNWDAYTGVEGGIPYVSTIYTNLTGIDNTGATVVRTAFQNALDNSPSNQVILVPAGTFLIVSNGESASLSWSRNGIVLRGAGPGATTLVCRGASGGFSTINIQNGAHDYDFNSVTKYNVWNTSLVNGDSNISTTIAHAFNPGELIWIDQRTNSNYIYQQGIPDPCNFCSGANRNADQRVYGQISRVVSISQNTNLVISPPIAGQFQSTNSPQIMLVNNTVKMSGVESMTFSNTTTSTTAYWFHTVGVENTWFTNCEFSTSRRRFIQTVNSFRMSVKQNYFHHGLGSDWTDSYGPDRGYCIYLAYGTSGARIEDNIFYHIHFAVSHEGAIAYNATYGNFHTNQIFNSRDTAQPSIGHHGSCPTHCLFEHNNLNSQISMDTYWGNGNNYVIFRNRVKNDPTHDGTTVDQYALNIDIWKWHRFENIVGNVLGNSSDSKVYIGNGDSVNTGGVRAMYRFGNPSANSTDYSLFDGPVTNTMILKNNYNAVTAGVPAFESIGGTNMVDSYLYASKPSWWGVSNWPSIGPDKTPTSEASMWLPALGRFYALNGAGTTNWFTALPIVPAKIGIGRGTVRIGSP